MKVTDNDVVRTNRQRVLMDMCPACVDKGDLSGMYMDTYTYPGNIANVLFTVPEV